MPLRHAIEWPLWATLQRLPASKESAYGGGRSVDNLFPSSPRYIERTLWPNTLRLIYELLIKFPHCFCGTKKGPAFKPRPSSTIFLLQQRRIIIPLKRLPGDYLSCSRCAGVPNTKPWSWALVTSDKYFHVMSNFLALTMIHQQSCVDDVRKCFLVLRLPTEGSSVMGIRYLAQ